jgi:hypothetical protein
MSDDGNRFPFFTLVVVTGVLIAFAAFFVGFLVAPLALLAVFFLAITASDRARRHQRVTAANAEQQEEIK